MHIFIGICEIQVLRETKQTTVPGDPLKTDVNVICKVNVTQVDPKVKWKQPGLYIGIIIHQQNYQNKTFRFIITSHIKRGLWGIKDLSHNEFKRRGYK